MGRRFRGTTRTANYQLSERIASKRRVAVLEGREGLHRPKPALLSKHVEVYTAYTEKTNSTSYKDAAVLAAFVELTGAGLLTK